MGKQTAKCDAAAHRQWVEWHWWPGNPNIREEALRNEVLRLDFEQMVAPKDASVPITRFHWTPQRPAPSWERLGDARVWKAPIYTQLRRRLQQPPPCASRR